MLVRRSANQSLMASPSGALASSPGRSGVVGWVVHIGGDHGVDATEMGHEFTHRPPQVVDRLVEVASARAGEVGAVGSDVVEVGLRSHPVKLPGLRGSARDEAKAGLPD